MLRERVAEDIFVFTSDLYLQATASAILTSEGSVLIDTLPFPQETREMLRFIKRHSQAPIRYLILTHFEPDHSYGACFIDGELVAHERCRRILEKHGEELLEEDRAQNPELCEVSIRLPETVFDRGSLTLHVGQKTIVLMHTPGNTSDGISAYARTLRLCMMPSLSRCGRGGRGCRVISASCGESLRARSGCLSSPTITPIRTHWRALAPWRSLRRKRRRCAPASPARGTSAGGRTVRLLANSA